MMSLKVLLKPKNGWLIALVVFATAISGVITTYSVSRYGIVSKQPETVTPIKEAKTITALGRLEPEAEVIRLSTPLSLDRDRISELLVKEGDRVKAGQVVAILDSQKRLRDGLTQAEEEVKIAQARLAQVKAGAKEGEISAQQASVERLQAQLQADKAAQQQTIARLEAQWEGDRIAQEATIRRLEAELKNAQAEYERYEMLYEQGVISSSEFDTKRLEVQTVEEQISEAEAVLNRINTTANKQISEAQVALNRIISTGEKEMNQAKATLNSIAEVRPVDVQVAQAEVENALAAVERAKTDLAQAYIKAPMAGTILKIYTRVGEKISESGILDIAQTDQMITVAEVYQTDIGKIKLGQQAVITSQAFAGKLRGVVSHIGLRVNRQNVFSEQPGENLDRRVVEVEIRLHPEDSKRVAGLTNLQVQTAIEL
jgi:HlyD family secretion protein